MHRTLLFTAASAATLVAADMGKAIVQNNCGYQVNLQNTPASGNGYSIISQTIAPGQSYSQTWTPTQKGGWSIKLSKDDNYQSQILQYEYTCQDNGVIWYDLSEVDGNPWKGDWVISAPAGAGCDPKQAAYRFWNDDDHGMQSSCPQETDITVTLCDASGGSTNNSAPSSASLSAAPLSFSAPAPAYSAPAPAPTSASASASASAPAASPPSYSAPAAVSSVVSDLGNALRFPVEGKELGKGDNEITHTTLATSVKQDGNYVATVTDVVTYVANVYVTQRAEPAHLRHRHHARHGHHA